MDLRIPIEEALLGQPRGETKAKFKDMALANPVSGGVTVQRKDLFKQTEATVPIIIQDDHDLDPQISIL